MQRTILKDLIASVVITGYSLYLFVNPYKALFGGRGGEWYALLGDPEMALYKYFYFLVIGPLLLIYGLSRLNRFLLRRNTIGISITSKVFDVYIGIISILAAVLVIRYFVYIL